MRRFIAAALLAGAQVAGGAVLTVASEPAAAGQAANLTLDGRGWGHGVGMAQDGAFWMGQSGASRDEILRHFYPGTRYGTAARGVRVGVWESGGPDGTVVVRLPLGGTVVDAEQGPLSPGFPLPVPPGGRVALTRRGAAYVAAVLPTPRDSESPSPTSGGSESPTAPPRARAVPAALAQVPTVVPTSPTPTPSPSPTPSESPSPSPSPSRTSDPSPEPSGSPSSSPEPTSSPSSPSPTPEPPPATAPPLVTTARPLVVLPAPDGLVLVEATGRSYRGAIHALAAAGGYRLVNQVDLEDYLRGMGEVRDPSWPPAAQEAQAVAARSYAVHAAGAPRPEGYDLCDDQRCQVYIGSQAEYAAMDRAVAATQGAVLMDRDTVANTVFSANGGGSTASVEEGFGEGSRAEPYLRPGPYFTRDPMPWRVTMPLATVAVRLGYRGRLASLAVLRRGPSGRALTVRLTGDAGVLDLPGLVVKDRLELRSTLFGTVTAAGSPPAGPADLPAAPSTGPVTGSLTPTGSSPVDRRPAALAATLCLLASGTGVVLAARRPAVTAAIGGSARR